MSLADFIFSKEVASIKVSFVDREQRSKVLKEALLFLLLFLFLFLFLAWNQVQKTLQK